MKSTFRTIAVLCNSDTQAPIAVINGQLRTTKHSYKMDVTITPLNGSFFALKARGIKVPEWLLSDKGTLTVTRSKEHYQREIIPGYAVASILAAMLEEGGDYPQAIEEVSRELKTVQYHGLKPVSDALTPLRMHLVTL